MKYFFIIGERSGDLHASNLIKAIKKQDENAVIEGVGGDLSQQEGMTLSYHYKDFSIMGFINVILHFRAIKSNFKKCKEAILCSQPDAVVLVDFPGFNLRMAKFAKERGFKVFYYIAPKVWASRESRIKTIKKYIDKVYTIFPFESTYFGENGVDIEYVGNPLLDSIANSQYDNSSRQEFIANHQLDDKPIVTLLAGSRKQEVKKLLPKLISVSKRFPSHQFVLAGVDNLGDGFYKSVAKDNLLRIIYNDTYALLHNSEAALVASGTATLETALLRIPQLVCYDIGGGSVLYYLYKALMIKVKYVSLVNLIMNKLVVKEYLQHHFNVENLEKELQQLLYNKAYRDSICSDYDVIIEKLGGVGASQKTALSIINILNS